MEFSRFGQRLGINLAIGILLVTAGALGAGWGCAGGNEEQVIQYEGEQKAPSETPAPSDTIQPPQGGTTGGTTGGDEIITPTTGGTTTGGTTGVVGEHCTDGSQSGDETDVDCGGSCAADCDFGKKCLSNDDCKDSVTFEGQNYDLTCLNPGDQLASSICLNATLFEGAIFAALAEQHCNNGIQDWGEGAVDCGGVCQKNCPFDACSSTEECKDPVTVGGTPYSGIECKTAPGIPINVCINDALYTALINWVVATPPCFEYAFVSNRDGGNENIYALPCGQTEPRKLTDNTSAAVHYNHINFSPDGTVLSYDAVIDGYGVFSYFDKLTDMEPTIPLDTDVANDGAIDYLAWSPTWSPPFAPEFGGGAIAFAWTDLMGLEGIKIQVGPDPLTAKDIINPFIGFIASTPVAPIEKVVWSPTTDPSVPTFNKVFYSVSVAGTAVISAADPSDPNKSTIDVKSFASPYLSLDPLSGHNPSISHDGRKLAYRSDDHHIWTCDLYRTIGADPSVPFICASPRQISGFGVCESPCWSADDQFIYFAAVGDIYRIKADGSETVKMTENTNTSDDKYPGCFPVVPPGP